MAKMTELEAAYRATTYRVFLPGGLCELKLDQSSDVLRCWLETAGASEFVILTAHNPGSKLFDQAENMLRQSQMELELLEAGYEPFAGENISVNADWPAEETCFVVNMALLEAKEIAAKYGQNALVYGVADAVLHLLWIEE